MFLHSRRTFCCFFLSYMFELMLTGCGYRFLLLKNFLANGTMTAFSLPALTQVGATALSVTAIWSVLGTVSCGIITLLQISQCEPCVFPSFVQVAATALSITASCSASGNSSSFVFHRHSNILLFLFLYK